MDDKSYGAINKKLSKWLANFNDQLYKEEL